MTKARAHPQLLLPLAVLVALIVALWASLTYAPQLLSREASAQEGLPSERAAAYRDALLKAYELREEAYLIAPSRQAVEAYLLNMLPPGATPAEIEAAVEEYYRDFHTRNNKASRPNPMARLGRMKQLEAAQRRGEEPPPLAGNPAVLTVMMNFSGQQTFQGGANGDPISLNGTCLTDTEVYTDGFTFTVDGPSFNEIEQPDDNWTPWVSPDSYTGGFSKEYFNLLMYSTEGYTERMRTDVPNPWDGGMGFDYSGVTFRNFFEENSRGIYMPRGTVEEITIPAAASFFGAGACNTDITDDSYWGRPHYSIAISAALQLNEQYPGADVSANPDFNWSEWDVEDVFDYDNDGNFQEPDGYVDHFFLIEAGQAEGGKYAEHLVWPHSSDVRAGAIGLGPDGNAIGGIQVATDPAHPLGSVWVLNYTVSDEVGGLGVLVHEYGHDIGLPDNYAYDVSGPNPGMWDLMNSGDKSGGLGSMRPAHMTIWDKFEPYIGWNDPVEIDATLPPENGAGDERGMLFRIGQQSIPPEGTVDGLKINLPDKVTLSSVEPFDTLMWYSGQGDTRQESIAQTFTPQAGEEVTVSTMMAYHIEADWDYMYWEVSGEQTGGWVPLEVYSGTTLLTTDEDPNGNNPTGNAITGSTDGWILAHAVIPDSITDGNPVTFRFRYFTDAAVQDEGIYLDNISIDGSQSGNLFSDDAEGGDTWTHMSEGINDSVPWSITNGVSSTEHYYLVEWRNSGEGTGFDDPRTLEEARAIAGFDVGLNRMYWVDELDEDGNIASIDRFFMHTPGMVIWYYNGSYGGMELGSPASGGPLFDGPSWGAKARVLAVDANPYPYFVEDAEVGPREVGERRSAFDGAFSLVDRPPFTLSSNYGTDPSNDMETVIPGDIAEPAFHDRLNYVPGIVGNAFVDYDAGVVIPSRDNVPYYAAWDSYLDAGNPGVNGIGVNLEVVAQAEDGTWGDVRFWMDDDTVFLRKHASAREVQVGEPVTYTITLKDAAGSSYEDPNRLYTFTASLQDALPTAATLVEGSLEVSNSPLAYYAPGTVSSEGNLIRWEGKLGGNPTTLEDAVIRYVVTYGEAGCYSDAATLNVTQEMLEDPFRNNGEPFLWPRREQYSAAVEVCVSQPTALTLDGFTTQYAHSGIALAALLLFGMVAVMMGVRHRRPAQP